MKEFNLEEFRKAKLPSQEEIMSSWQSDEAKPIVSVICLTFNQEQYIEDAIRGFLIQKTSFPFEIIIHDDASTDSTTEIIKNYANKYKKIIKTIIQKENQYTKSANSVVTIPAKTAKGEYLAFCEGDDFWIDSLKLTKQERTARENPSASIITHNAITILEKRNKSIPFKPIKKKLLFSATDILTERNQFAPTASYFIKKEVIDALPAWFHEAPYGDFFIEIYSQKIGTGIFLPDLMSIYRLGAPGSWTETTRASKTKIIVMHEKMLKLYQLMKNDFPEEAKGLQSRIKDSYLEIISQATEINDKEKYTKNIPLTPPSIEKSILTLIPNSLTPKTIKTIKTIKKIAATIKRKIA